MSKFKEGPLVLMLRDGEVEQFNASTRKTETLDLSNANLRGADLRHVDLHKADLPETDPPREGASFHRARVSGAYFPANVPAEEIKMSLELGTRIRCRPA